MSEPAATAFDMEAAGWLAGPRAQIVAAVARDRAPQALLVHDAPGAGGDQLALWAARLLLCTATDRPCGRCNGCQGVLHARHPDLIELRLEEDSQQIKVDQVRTLIQELALASHQGGWRVALIDPADAMNRNAANSLLKTLEEPASRTLLLLVAQQPSRLPATIHSRCLRVRIRPPSRAQALAWLARGGAGGDWNPVLDLIGDAPLIAGQMDPAAVAQLRDETVGALHELVAGGGDAAATADRWARSGLELRLACFERWLTERIRSRLGATLDSTKLRPGSHASGAATVSNPMRLFEALDRLREFRASLAGGINRSLALESLLRSLA